MFDPLIQSHHETLSASDATLEPQEENLVHFNANMYKSFIRRVIVSLLSSFGSNLVFYCTYLVM